VDLPRIHGYRLDAKLEAGNVNAKLPREMYATVLETFSDDENMKVRVAELRRHLSDEEL